MVSSSNDRTLLLNQAIDLINEAKNDSKEEKLNKLAQVQELSMHRDTTLLEDTVPMIVDFQTDGVAATRKFVLTFLRDVVMTHPQYVVHLSSVVTLLLNTDESDVVRKQCVLNANAVYRIALRWLAQGHGTAADWESISAMKNAVLEAITLPAEVSSVVIKFAETLVLAYVPGTGLGLYAHREGDKSVHRELPDAHPFLRKVMLEQEGMKIVNSMAEWLKNGKADGARLEKKHYQVLENSLQNIATSRQMLFPVLLPAFADAMERATAPISPRSNSSTSALKETAGQLTSSCLKLIKVAPKATPMLQTLCTAVAAREGDAEKVRTAIESNPAIKGRIIAGRSSSVSSSSRGAPSSDRANSSSIGSSSSSSGIRPQRVSVSSSSGNGAPMGAAALVLACLKKVLPRPPPGHTQHETEGLGTGPAVITYILDLLAMEGVGTMLEGGQTRKRPRPEKSSSAPSPEDDTAVSSKKHRALVEGPDTDKAMAVVPDDVDSVAAAAAATADADSMDVIAAAESDAAEAAAALGDAMAVVDSEQAAEAVEEVLVPEEPVVLDPIQLGLKQAHEAFTRVVMAEEGAFLEGRAPLQRKLVAKLGRMLCEADAAAGASANTTLQEVVTFFVQDYSRRHESAMALLHELYVADFRAASASSSGSSSSAAAFELYDAACMTLLRHVPTALFRSKQGQKLFVKTVLGCPRLPDSAIALVCGFCDRATDSDEVQTSLLCLRDLVFYKPTARTACLNAVLRFTSHKNKEARTKAVRLTANMLWPKPGLRSIVETFARDALQSALPPLTAPAPSPTACADEDQIDFDEADEADADNSSSTARANGTAGEHSQNANGSSSSRRSIAAELWQHPPKTKESAVCRLSLYCALCVRNSALLKGLYEGYARAPSGGPVQEAIEDELPALSAAAATRMGAPELITLVAEAPSSADPLVLATLNHLIPLKENAPTAEVVAAVRALRAARVAAAAAAATTAAPAATGTAATDAGIQFLIPALAGLGKDGVAAVLAQILRADKATVETAFRRLVEPLSRSSTSSSTTATSALYTPAQLLVLLHTFDCAAEGVPMKKLTEAVSVCLDSRAVYSYQVLREALDIMSKAAGEPVQDTNGATPAATTGATVGATTGARRGLPLLFMRTVILAVQGFPELKQYVAVGLLPRLVAQEVWTQPRAWDGFLRLAKIMGTESGATSFIALMQLPAAQLKEVLKLHKSLKESLKAYAAGVIKVDPGVREVLGL